MTTSEIEAFYRNMGISMEESIRQLTLHTTEETYRKGDCILHEGDPLTTIYFHISGVARAYVIAEDGEESVIGFCFQHGAPTLGASGLAEPFAQATLEAVAPMELLTLPISVATAVMENDPSVSLAVQRFMAADHNKDRNWYVALQTMQGEEKYKWFMEEYKGIAPLIPKKDIASFLHLRPQSLSRILANLK